MKKKLNILFVISEADPYIKVGGLGDIGGTLPIALKSLKTRNNTDYEIDVRVILPYHDQIKDKHVPSEWITNFRLMTKRGFKDVYLSRIVNSEVPIYLIDGNLIRNTKIYTDNPYRDLEKFAFFSIASLEVCKQLNWQPDILHSHDWHTALSVKSLRQRRARDTFFKKTRSLYTVHNLPYSGGNYPEILETYGIRPAFDSHIFSEMRTLPMAVALEASDAISTVSRTYAEEITTPEFGNLYENYLLANKQKITGIVNGIMMDQWNPATDTIIAQTYDENSLDDRIKNKLSMQEEFNLAVDPRMPLFAMVGRMSQQKGIDLCLDALRRMGELPWQAIILGTGEREIENNARSLANELSDRVRVEIRYDGVLARKLYAAGDMFLMPSRYEPCGIAQMISMLYGCIPIARATGGLKDTIIDASKKPKAYTGFLFDKANTWEAENAMRRALNEYQDQEAWRNLQLRAMNQDFSWEKQAWEYVKLYEKLLAQKKIKQVRIK